MEENYPFVPPPPTGWLTEMVEETGYAKATIRRALRGWEGKDGRHELHRTRGSVAEQIRRLYAEKFVIPHLKDWKMTKIIEFN